MKSVKEKKNKENEKDDPMRVLKNRQSARDSRDRKRRYLADLEMSRAQLYLQIQALQERVARLESEKLSLINQISLFRQQNSSIKMDSLTSDPLMPVLPLPPFRAVLPTTSSSSSKSIKIASIAESVESTEPANLGSSRDSSPTAFEPYSGVKGLTSIMPPLSNTQRRRRSSQDLLSCLSSVSSSAWMNNY